MGGLQQQSEGIALKAALKTKLTEGGLKLAEVRYPDTEKVEESRILVFLVAYPTFVGIQLG